MTNAEAVMGGCDLTADCPADEHAEGCWRGYWSGADRENCDHGSHYVNDDGAQVCLVCGHATDDENGGADDEP